MDNFKVQHNIVKNGFVFNKGCLFLRDTLWKDIFKTIDKDFGDDFVQDITKGSLFEIFHICEIFYFWDKDNGCSINMRKQITRSKPGNASVENFKSTQMPESLEKNRV